MDGAAFTGTPGGMPMAFVRCYTGTDGQSHFEDLDLLPPDKDRAVQRSIHDSHTEDRIDATEGDAMPTI